MRKKPKTSQRDLLPEEQVDAREAIHTALTLLKARWDGPSDFDQGMRALQRTLHIKPRKR